MIAYYSTLQNDKIIPKFFSLNTSYLKNGLLYCIEILRVLFAILKITFRKLTISLQMSAGVIKLYAKLQCYWSCDTNIVVTKTRGKQLASGHMSYWTFFPLGCAELYPIVGLSQSQLRNTLKYKYNKDFKSFCQNTVFYNWTTAFQTKILLNRFEVLELKI